MTPLGANISCRKKEREMVDTAPAPTFHSPFAPKSEKRGRKKLIAPHTPPKPPLEKSIHSPNDPLAQQGEWASKKETHSAVLWCLLDELALFWAEETEILSLSLAPFSLARQCHKGFVG